MSLKLQLDDVALFVRIVETGSLSAAARERQVPVSQVTRALARLEKACGARLLHRSTHGLSLTDEGDGVLQHARRLTETVADLEGTLAGPTAGPSGWLRLSVSTIIAQAVVAPWLVALYDAHPALHVEVSAEDRIVDMARDGIDLAVRTGSPAGEHLVARPIGQLTRSLYAAPAYLARHGTPRRRDDLAGHRLLTNASHPALNRWRHRRDGSDWVARGHTRCDNTAVLASLAISGVGIARIIDLAARPLVRSGALVPVLPREFSTDPVPMFAVMLRERHRLPKVRACIDHLAAWLAAAGEGPG